MATALPLQLRLIIPSSLWILSTGFWTDASSWVDTSTWID